KHCVSCDRRFHVETHLRHTRWHYAQLLSALAGETRASNVEADANLRRLGVLRAHHYGGFEAIPRPQHPRERRSRHQGLVDGNLRKAATVAVILADSYGHQTVRRQVVRGLELDPRPAILIRENGRSKVGA